MVTNPTQGLQSSYDFSTGVKINMDEAIYMISPMDTPLLTGFGSDGNMVLPKLPVDETKFEWMDEEALLPESVLADAPATTAVFVTVAAGHQIRFSTGDIIAIFKAGGSERMQVTGYGTTTDTLTVTRAYSGTATNYSIGTKIRILGQALAEGSDPENARSADRDQYYNLTQIIGPTKISITRTEQGRSKYGVSNELSHQTFLRMAESAIQREVNFIYGVRTEDVPNKKRTSGGVDYFVTSNVDTTSTQITVASLSTSMLSCWDAGGIPDMLVANPKSLGDLNSANDTVVRTVNTDTMRGVRRVSVVTTEYGDISIVRNRYVEPIHAFGLQRDGITRRVFDEVALLKLALTGDAENWMFVGEEGLEVKGEQHMFKMNNLTAYA